ncbi:piezo-type mechanosensitive ion channel component-like [Sitophilus oryzae]|uniref:Piezo-type mechanosensitive ion channel component n=2 Tax=Sitophilus oryzae TaxID=7048 RepID=A0A6J2X2K8_SITOR|nr:piezo-type mechanosensitive ion channel component-like [Sitophilus oryzae]
MTNYWLAAFTFRIVFPILVLCVVYLRPTITTYIYLLMAFYMPFFSVPTAVSMTRDTGVFVKSFVVVSLLISLSVFCFYFVVFSSSTIAYNIEPCSFIESVLRAYGVVDFRDLPGHSNIDWLLPELIMTISGPVLWLILSKMTQETVVSIATGEADIEELKAIHNKHLLNIATQLGVFVWIFLLCFCAVIRISPFGGLYYLLFLGFLTYWATFRTFGRVCAKIIGCITPIIFIHITLIYVFQFKYFNTHPGIGRILIRIFKLYPYKTSAGCGEGNKDPRLYLWVKQRGITNFLPCALYALYLLSVLLSRHILNANDGVLSFVVAIFRRERGGPAGKWIYMIRRVKENIDYQRSIAVLQAEHTTFSNLKYIYESVFYFGIGASYLIANFTMLIWSIMYVTQRDLIIFIWANIVWLIPNGKAFMLKSSPFLIGFLWFHLILLYTYSSRLTQKYLVDRIWYFKLSVGTDTTDIGWMHLLLQSTFGIIVFCAMRQYFHDKRKKTESEQIADIMGAKDHLSKGDFGKLLKKSVVLSSTASILYKWLALLWLWLVVILMIWLEFWGTSSLFKILFVVLAIFLIMSFQLVPFDYWKKCLRVYWWILIGYAGANFILFYLYQSNMTRRFLLAYIASEKTFFQYGMIQRKLSERYKPLLYPLFFQLAVVIQKNYLQDDFDLYTSPYKEDEFESAKDSSRWMKMLYYSIIVKNMVFQILEVHFQRILLLLGWYVCVMDLCGLNLIFAILLSVACCTRRKTTITIIYVYSVFNQILIILRLCYMHLYGKHAQWNYLGEFDKGNYHYNVTLNGAEWIGFDESKYGHRYAEFSKVAWSFLYTGAVTLFRMVQIRQMNYRLARGMPAKRPDVIFPNIDYKNCHDSAANMLKFLVNFGFYKMGLEITAVFAAIVLFIRMDVYSILSSLTLIAMLMLKRKWIKNIWFLVISVLAFQVPLHYLMHIGFYPAFYDYTMSSYWTVTDTRMRLQQFFYLMNMVHPPTYEKLYYDFVLLLLVARQWRTFKAEKRHADNREFPGGSNEEVYHLIDDPTVVNPVPDYINITRNAGDVYKYVIFTGWFYLSLLFTFLAGTMRPTIYSFGYILFAFLLAWEGQDFFLREPKSIIFRWNMLILYNLLIMLCRSISQLFGCVLIYEISEEYCRIFKLLALGCVDKLGSYDLPYVEETTTCVTSTAGLGAGWDTACFAFLIFQQRIFKSYYFFHIVNDVKVETILGDRGADLIENYRSKKEAFIKEELKNIEQNMEVKLKRIRKNEAKISNIRGGDYTDFDYVERQLNIPLLPEPDRHVDADFDPTDPMVCSEYLGLLIKTNIVTVLEERKDRRHMKMVLKNQAQKQKQLAMARRKTVERIASKLDEVQGDLEATITKHIMYFMLAWGLFESLVVSFTRILNSSTRTFRQVSAEINEEKSMIRGDRHNLVGERLGKNKVWSPTRTYENIKQNNKIFIQPQKQEFLFSIYSKLLRAILYVFLTYSEWFCYACIIVRHVYRSDFISLPLLIMVFCWGSLSMPRPSKTFWIVGIAYILITLLIQSFFVMDIADWNVDSFSGNIFYPPYMIGLQRNMSTTFAIAMLVSLFFHRGVLQVLGLWKPHHYRPTTLVTDGNYYLKDKTLLNTDTATSPPEKVYTIDTSVVKLGDYLPSSVSHGLLKYGEQMKMFIQQMLSPSSAQVPVDVYTPMFLCDLINTIIMIFYFNSFGSLHEKHGIVGFMMTNKVPMEFIVTFLIQISLMVIDRWIYKGKRRFIKIMFHFFQVFSYHMWYFVIYPMVTNRVFSETPPVQIFYVIKCIYFLLSAYQIRNGYPMLISMHFLWHRYGTFNRFAFKFYNLCPYLFELRTLLDWTITDTCLGVSEYFKMEDITANMFDQMCEREFENLTSKESGRKKKRKLKYTIGGILFIVLTLTLILPFLLFSISDKVGVATSPSVVRLKLYIGTMQPIYECPSDQRSWKEMTDDHYMNLTRTFNIAKSSQSIFDHFKPEDVIVVRWQSFSSKRWDISPRAYKNLVQEVESFKPVHIRLTIEYVHRGTGGKKQEKTFGQSSSPIKDKERAILLKMLTDESASDPLLVPMVFPKFLSIDKDGTPEPLPLMEFMKSDKYLGKTHGAEDDKVDDDDDIQATSTRFRSLLIALERDQGKLWWEIRESCEDTDENYKYYLKGLVHNSCKYIVMYLFNEKVFSSSLSLLTESGILGMYLIYFMIILGLLQDMTIKIDEIWLEDIDNPEKLLTKCFEVYLARDMKNFELEQELVDELVFIMRSPDLCIRLSRDEED